MILDEKKFEKAFARVNKQYPFLTRNGAKGFLISLQQRVDEDRGATNLIGLINLTLNQYDLAYKARLAYRSLSNAFYIAYGKRTGRHSTRVLTPAQKAMRQAQLKADMKKAAKKPKLQTV